MSYYGYERRRESSSGGSLVGLCLYMLIHFCVAKAGGCSPSNERFNGALRSEGLQDARKHGYDFFECGYGDVWVEGFTAKLPAIPQPGEELVTRVSVDGTLCCGILKGCTIRWP